MLDNQIQNKHLVPTNTFLIDNFLIDNRQQNDNQETLWDKLNLSQKFAVCNLGQFGYLLTYVRFIGNNTLAILKQDNKIATVNEAGVININPAITCRQ
jgi:hypothetical protein